VVSRRALPAHHPGWSLIGNDFASPFALDLLIGAREGGIAIRVLSIRSEGAPANRLCSPLVRGAALLASVVLWTGTAIAQAPQQQPPSPQQRAAMLQQWLKASQAQLRGYEWVETTVVAKDGEEKSRKQNTCYYGADGNLQKVPVAAEPQASGRERRLGHRVREAAKEELTAYMQSAVQLVHSYVPPDPARIRQSVSAGKLSVNMVEPGRRVRLDFRDY
jgi:hypothetical protein